MRPDRRQLQKCLKSLFQVNVERPLCGPARKADSESTGALLAKMLQRIMTGQAQENVTVVPRLAGRDEAGGLSWALVVLECGSPLPLWRA
jgi:hypothetical protein